MYWLGYDHYKVQNTEIGSRNKHCDNGKDASEYFDSMRDVCSEVYRTLKHNGYFCIVIGDSIINKKLFLLINENIQKHLLQIQKQKKSNHIL
jgi:DNA modification methylase